MSAPPSVIPSAAKSEVIGSSIRFSTGVSAFVSAVSALFC